MTLPAPRSQRPEEQLDLFRALPGDMAPRDSQDLMAFPFFSLAKSRRVAPIDFRAGIGQCPQQDCQIYRIVLDDKDPEPGKADKFRTVRVLIPALIVPCPGAGKRKGDAEKGATFFALSQLDPAAQAADRPGHNAKPKPIPVFAARGEGPSAGAGAE